MPPHTSFKEGGKEFPLNEIALVIVRDKFLEIFFFSGKTDTEWCALSHARQAFQKHNIAMFEPNRNTLLRYEIFERISKKNKVVLKQKFIDLLQPDKRPLAENICMSRRKKKAHKDAHGRLHPLTQPAAVDILHFYFSAYTCTAEWAQHAKVVYHYLPSTVRGINRPLTE